MHLTRTMLLSQRSPFNFKVHLHVFYCRKQEPRINFTARSWTRLTRSWSLQAPQTWAARNVRSVPCTRIHSGTHPTAIQSPMSLASEYIFNRYLRLPFITIGSRIAIGTLRKRRPTDYLVQNFCAIQRSKCKIQSFFTSIFYQEGQRKKYLFMGSK